MSKQKFYPVGNRRFSFRAFTLIELMVVIDIIGLVASIVLVTLSRARAKARDARILLDLRQIISIAALIESTYYSYGYLCAIDTTLNENAPYPYGDQLKAIEDDIAKQQGEGFPILGCRANTTGYCVDAELNSENRFCVDSTRGAQIGPLSELGCLEGDPPRCETPPEAGP